jgi:hypothetical protein
MLMAASGALVPIATTKTPIMKEGIFNTSAIREAALIRLSAPFTRMIKPIANVIYVITKSVSFSTTIHH